MDNRSENREAAVNCAVGARGSEGRAPQHPTSTPRRPLMSKGGPGQSGSVRTPGACRGNGGAVPRRLRQLNRYPSSAARGLQACGGGHVHEAGAPLACAQAFFGPCKLAGDMDPRIAVKRQLRATVSVSSSIEQRSDTSSRLRRLTSTKAVAPERAYPATPFQKPPANPG
jgi:hypothetical protein